MKNWLIGALVVAVATTMVPGVSEAKRLGGGKSQGMQRSLPARSTPQTPPAQPAAPQPAAPTQGVPATAGATAAAAAAAPAKRNWMGPIAGLAAGLGIAALLSHFGMGEGMANILMMALLVFGAFFLIRFLMQRFGGGASQRGQLATAGANSPPWASTPRSVEPVAEPVALPRVQAASPVPAGAGDVSVTGAPLAPLAGVPATAAAQTSLATTAPVLPAGFDLPAFERVAKMIFIRLQAANDSADLEDLRQFTTPEMFASARLELQERGGVAQHTDVERVDAELIEFTKEDGRQIASVRFHGLVREDKAAEATKFDEVWHLVKPEDDSRSWAIAGIQQAQ